MIEIDVMSESTVVFFYNLIRILRSLLNCLLYVPTCQRYLHTYVVTCHLRVFYAYVPSCECLLRIYVLTCQGTLRAYVFMCQRALRA